LVAPASPASPSRQHEGQQLVFRHVVAQRYRPRLVFANGLEDLAEGRMNGALDQPEGDGKNRHHEVIQIHVVGEVEAEQGAARHALQAVLATGEGRLQEQEEHHLRQRQGHHGEVDALAADGEAADHPAQPRRGRCRPAAKQCRQFPYFQGVARDIGRRAEKHRMAEGQAGPV
jgi:hypothetical protein